MATRDALAETIAADARVLGALQEILTSVGVKSDDALFRQRLERTLLEYVVTRGAASEIATALLSLGAGAVTLGKLTPGAVSFGPTLASIVAQQTAISSFPLGVGFGTLWYGLFPPASSPLLLFGFSGGLLMVASIIAAFAGVITDPLQRRLGLHQRRLRRMIDAMERHMLDPAAPDYTVGDRYVARLLDAFDLITAAVPARAMSKSTRTQQFDAGCARRAFRDRPTRCGTMRHTSLRSPTRTRSARS
jgi:hypothetical protein